MSTDNVVQVTVRRGDRTIEVSEALESDDIVSDRETLEMLHRVTRAAGTAVGLSQAAAPTISKADVQRMWDEWEARSDRPPGR
ncbi:MAG: hypothetical protein ACOC9R_01330 [bacterium]